MLFNLLYLSPGGITSLSSNMLFASQSDSLHHFCSATLLGFGNKCCRRFTRHVRRCACGQTAWGPRRRTDGWPPQIPQVRSKQRLEDPLPYCKISGVEPFGRDEGAAFSKFHTLSVNFEIVKLLKNVIFVCSTPSALDFLFQTKIVFLCIFIQLLDSEAHK